jgi:hypothetical protein
MMPLSQVELTESRDALKQAEALVAKVRDNYLEAGGYLDSARLLNEVCNSLSDEVAALNKVIGS